jgi:hypothetical protein
LNISQQISKRRTFMTIATANGTTKTAILSDELLARCYQRAPIYDRENRFFFEDFEELKNSGYLTMPVPKELGGAGMTLAEVCRQQRRLAYYAPATAVAVNMHLYWTGVAADLWRGGDKSLEWLLKAAVQGEVRRARRGRQRHTAHLFIHQGRARRRRLPLHRPQIVWQPDTRVDLPGASWYGEQRQRKGRRQDHPCLYAARR